MMKPAHDHDADFLALVNAQRAILNRLNSQKPTKKAVHGRLQPVRRMETYTTNLEERINYSQSTDEDTDPLSLMNQPMRRLSLELTGWDVDLYHSNELNGEEEKYKRRKFENRRFSLFDTPTKPSRNTMGRESISGLFAGVSLDQESISAPTTPKCSNLSNKREEWYGAFQKASSDKLKKLERSNITLPSLKVKTFAQAMDKSIKSQQDIHKWDKMMGLKRSHSKTMRLSMQSRNKLRRILKSNRRLSACG